MEGYLVAAPSLATPILPPDAHPYRQARPLRAIFPPPDPGSWASRGRPALQGPRPTEPPAGPPPSRPGGDPGPLRPPQRKGPDLRPAAPTCFALNGPGGAGGLFRPRPRVAGGGGTADAPYTAGPGSPGPRPGAPSLGSAGPGPRRARRPNMATAGAAFLGAGRRRRPPR